jgi:hypothetical protein
MRTSAKLIGNLVHRVTVRVSFAFKKKKNEMTFFFFSIELTRLA